MKIEKSSGNQKVLARLSLAALLIDFLIIVMISHMLTEPVSDVQQVGQYTMTPIIKMAALFFAVFIVYLFVCEIILGSFSPGQLLLGIKVLDPQGQKLSVAMRIKRLGLKLFSFGITALNPNQLPFYNRSKRVVVVSDIFENAQAVSNDSGKSWTVTVASGVHKGKKSRINLPSDMSGSITFKIGRDAAWADLALNNENKVSSRHSILRRAGNNIQIMDAGTNGKGSKNGTMINGRKISPGVWTPVGSNAQIHVANVLLKISS